MPTPSRRQKREEARRLFLTGECRSNAEIGRRLRMKPHTVGKIRREEAWDELRLKVDRQAAERMVESLAGERVSLNVRHYNLWQALIAFASETMKRSETLDIRALERLALVIDRAQKGQRLARGLSLDGETEEQLRAQHEAESRKLVDAFIEAIKAHVPDEAARDQIRLAVMASFPGESEDGDGA